MSGFALTAPAETRAPSATRPDLTLALAIAALYWCLLFDQLRVDWEVNPQYNYGWFVPGLALGLFWRRWLTRPEPRASSPAPWFLALVVLLVASLLPIRLIEEANAGWRRILWYHAVQVLVLSLGALWYMGGWAWIRHFAFPVVFLLISVPWPDKVEAVLIQGMMRSVAAMTVDILGVLGIPALQQGNLLQTSAGVVGVDEACSGIRSFQTSLMVGLFLGELYQLTGACRRLLLGVGVVAAFLANVGRTSLLTWRAARQGMERMNQWHDAAGLAVVFAILTVLWGAALWLRCRSRVARPSIRAPTRPQDDRPADVPVDRRPDAPSPASLPAVSPALPRFPSRPVLLGLLLWLAVVVAGTELWYLGHERNLMEAARWTISWPTDSPSYNEVKVPDRALAMLRCSTSKSSVWRDETGNLWHLIYLSWPPVRSAATQIGGHRPDICLSGAGWELIEDRGVLIVNANGIELPFRHYLFDRGGRAAHVFHCIWEDRVPKSGQRPVGEHNLGTRLQAVAEGRRQMSRTVLEIALVGPGTPEEAVQALRRQLQQTIRRQ